MTKCTLLATAGLISVIATTSAEAQWTVTRVAMAQSSGELRGVSETEQVGYVDGHARVWRGAAMPFVNLTPPGASGSLATGVFNGRQVGAVEFNGNAHASLWSGTAEAWIDLSPARAETSIAYAISGNQQVGVATLDRTRCAFLWSGTAASAVNLHTPGAVGSIAYGISGLFQVGCYLPAASGPNPSYWRACLWNGTAASLIDLHPSGYLESQAYGGTDGYQVGIAVTDSPRQSRAGLWNGTAESWVELHPPNTTASIAYAVHGGQQVGAVHYGGGYRASLWRGTAESWVDLSAFLPAEEPYHNTHATSIWSNGHTTRVGGYGVASRNGGGIDLLLWELNCPEPLAVVSHPADASACPSSGASFSITASGTGPLRYQWQIQPMFAEVGPWSDLTSTSLTLPCGGTVDATSPHEAHTSIAIRPCDKIAAYRVRCLVTNPCGSIPSDEAVLQVLPTLWIESQPVGTSVGVDVPVSFFVQAGGVADCGTPLTYQWQRRDPNAIDPNAPTAWLDLQEGSQFLNVRSAGLMIVRPSPSIATGYRCRISGGCDCSPESGFIYSDEVNFGMSCPADFNADGGVDFSDVEAFFERWESGC